MEGETIDRIAALIKSSRALSGVLALVISCAPGELSASEIDALTDLFVRTGIAHVRCVSTPVLSPRIEPNYTPFTS